MQWKVQIYQHAPNIFVHAFWKVLSAQSNCHTKNSSLTLSNYTWQLVIYEKL